MSKKTESILLKMWGTTSIIAAYAIYLQGNPGTDGMIFGSVMVGIGLILGVDLTHILQRKGGS